MSKQAHQARGLRASHEGEWHLISLPYLSNIEVHHVPAPYVLREMASAAEVIR